MPLLSRSFTLLRRPSDDQPQPITAADDVSLTADFPSRASGDVRRAAWDMVERFSSLEPVEAICHIGEASNSREPEPGILLLDRRFPIWLAILDDRTFISVDSELLEGAARARFQVASEYVAFLAARGYAHLFDHRTRTWHHADGGATNFVRRLTVGATTRRLDQLRTDWRVGFLAAFTVYVLIDMAMGRSLRAAVAKGLVLGTFVNGIQYAQARRALVQRLRQLREDILFAREPPEHLTFRKPAKTLWGESLGALFVGTIATGALLEDFWGNVWIGLPILLLFAATLWSLLLSRRVFVVLDGQSIEGVSTHRRVQMPYLDVDRIRQHRVLGLTTVSSAHQFIQIPGYLERYLQLVDLVWDRVSSAVPDSAAPLIHGRTDSPARFEAILHDARQTARFIWPVLRASAPPLWMYVFDRRHPLRRQYRWHPHLLRHGRVVLGLVIHADERLRHVAREEHVFDAPALVLFAPDLPLDQAGDLLEEVMARLWEDPDDDDVEDLRRRLDDQAPYPLGVTVPASLTHGIRVVCSSVMVVRRNVPLGWLRSPWIPLLIDSAAFPFATVLPARYWDPSWKTSWKAPVKTENGWTRPTGSTRSVSS